LNIHFRFIEEVIYMSQNWTPPPPPQYAPANIPNYLIPAILSTVLCCLPAGIVSIVYAAQVNGKVAAGDIQGAMDSSKNARTWMYISVGLGIVACVLGFLFGLFGAIAGQQR
jgi:hypothetical protein